MLHFSSSEVGTISKLLTNGAVAKLRGNSIEVVAILRGSGALKHSVPRKVDAKRTDRVKERSDTAKQTDRVKERSCQMELKKCVLINFKFYQSIFYNYFI
ncbi:MAG: hypothetical protein ATN31_04405 [Candidatus Epulonipiscioides saccharophilum]|nr:MAG: hypothetical protein ATN31_04405 [Epulopiscium sp. AS2M-Bin001]